MNRFVLTLSRIFLIGLVSIIVLSAALVGIGRQFVSHIHEAKPEVESYLSNTTGLDIRFQNIVGQWEQLTPSVSLRQLQIQTADNTPSFLGVKEVKAEINLGNSLLYMRPIIKLWVDGLAIDLAYADGKFVLDNGPKPSAKFEKKNDSDGGKLFDQIDFWLKQPHIQLSNSAIKIKGFWKQDVVVSDINIGMARRGASKRFWIDLILAGESDVWLTMKGEMQGRFGDQESLNGNLYAKMMAPNLAPWMPIPMRELTALDVYEAEGAIELWGNIEKGKFERVTSRFGLADVLVGREGSDIRPPKLNRVAGEAKWQGDWREDWLVGFQNFEIDGEDFHWAPKELVLHSKKMATNARRYLGRIDTATVSPWVRYYASLLDPQSKAYQTLNTVQPEATLDNVLISVDMVDQSVSDYQVLADLSQITTQPKRWIPGVNNVTAKALIGKYLSVIDLEGRDIDLNYPALFREVLPVNRVTGALLFRNSTEEWALESGLLEIDDDQLQGVTQLAVIKDKTSENSPYLRLQANISEIDAKENLYSLLPVGVIPDGVERWIDGAVKQGSMLRGDLLFHGPVNLFELEPFQYILGFTLEDVALAYLPEWKAVEGITTDVRIYNGKVDAWALTGDYYGMKVDSAWVGTARNEDGDVELAVDAHTTGRVEDAIQILIDSPIKDVTAPIMETIAVKGNGDVQVDIKVPFRKEKNPDKPPLSLSVDVQVDDGEFDLVGKELTIDKLQGSVKYDLAEGLSSSGMSGEVFGGALSATIETKADDKDPAKQQTVVLTKGAAPLEKIKPWLKLDLISPMSGDIEYSANVFLKPESEESSIKRSYLEVSSDLVGVSINYPEPLFKESETEKPFNFKLSLGGEKQFQTISFADIFDLHLVNSEEGMSRGSIAFGETATLPNEEVFTIAGDISKLDLDAWQKAYKSIRKAREGYGLVPHSTADLINLGDSSLLISELKVSGQTFKNVDISLSQESENLIAAVRSPKVTANMVLPTSYLSSSNYRDIKEPVIVDVKHLALNVLKDDKETETAPEQSDEPKAVLDPRILPAMYLKVDHLQLSGEDFGAWQLNWTPSENGVAVNDASFDFRAIKFEGKGRWEWDGETPKTFLNGKATSKNVADVLTNWGYAKSLSSKYAHAVLEGDWDGAPYEFDLNTASANWELVIKDGRFKDVSSGTADKVLGILNFDDWLSRMQLKIKDLDSNELPFSVIRGDFVLQDQVLSSKELTIDSAAIKMTLDGSLGLADQQINADLDVAIPVTRNLVLPAAAVGGLPAAATVYVIEKVLGSQLDKLTTMEYTVEGPFSDPTVTLKESFNIIPKQIQESIMKNGKNGKAETAEPEPEPKSETKPEPALEQPVAETVTAPEEGMAETSTQIIEDSKESANE